MTRDAVEAAMIRIGKLSPRPRPRTLRRPRGSTRAGDDGYRFEHRPARRRGNARRYHRIGSVGRPAIARSASGSSEAKEPPTEARCTGPRSPRKQPLRPEPAPHISSGPADLETGWRRNGAEANGVTPRIKAPSPRVTMITEIKAGQPRAQDEVVKAKACRDHADAGRGHAPASRAPARGPGRGHARSSKAPPSANDLRRTLVDDHEPQRDQRIDGTCQARRHDERPEESIRRSRRATRSALRRLPRS